MRLGIILRSNLRSSEQTALIPKCNAPLLQKASVKIFEFPQDITNLSEVIIGNGINVI
jgi:hypothetical protein